MQRIRKIPIVKHNITVPSKEIKEFFETHTVMLITGRDGRPFFYAPNLQARIECGGLLG
jgi:hypothetical protein